MRKIQIIIALSVFAILFCTGCATTKPKPIAYLSLEKPSGTIGVIKHNSVKNKIKRGGWYFGNHNFRPAPDVASYIKQTSEEAGSDILRDADIRLAVPFAFDILFFGYNSATDMTTANGQ